MTSSINPNNIDGAYPVAGQDNDSQGFRDNFTNTKTNFAYAAQEITDLQNNAVLKGPLQGSTLDNNMNGSVLSNAVLQDIAETRVALGTVSGSQTINYAAGSYYTLTTNGSVTLAFTTGSWPPAGQLGRLRVQITVVNTAHTLTLPAAVTVGTTGIQGWSSNVITFAATGTYEFEFETSDGGSTITIFDLNRPLVAGYTNQLQLGSSLVVGSYATVNSYLALPGYEDLANAAAANINVTTSYVTTAGPETATLGVAPMGTIKVLYARDVTLGPMVITATAPAWGGAGNITLNTTGSACTMMSTGGGWVCIGNNGASFS